MGIYDREYYRGETRGNLWLSGTAPVCRALVIANVAIFLLESLGLLNKHFVDTWFVARSADIFWHGYVWQLVTAAFVHADVFHLLGNMLILWFVGREMEAMYGSKDFAALYFSAAILSFLGCTLFHLSPESRNTPILGASGAIFAILVLYALYYPRREILLMFVIPVEVWLLVTLYIAYNLLLLFQADHWNTAVEAHLVGASYGYLYKRFDLRWSHRPWFKPRARKLRVVYPDSREKPVARPSTSGPTWSPNSAGSAKPSAVPAASIVVAIAEEQLDARLDEVLAKIAREGRGGLTEDENLVLQEASLRARNRRSDRV